MSIDWKKRQKKHPSLDPYGEDFTSMHNLKIEYEYLTDNCLYYFAPTDIKPLGCAQSKCINQCKLHMLSRSGAKLPICRACLEKTVEGHKAVRDAYKP